VNSKNDQKLACKGGSKPEISQRIFCLEKLGNGVIAVDEAELIDRLQDDAKDPLPKEAGDFAHTAR
jgi:hypothetical protein